MSTANSVPLSLPHEVRDSCLCLHVQRAARALARRFDEAFRSLGLTNGQFSLLMTLNRPTPPTVSEVSAMLAMDRTTLTAALKPLVRRKLVKVSIDPADRRRHALALTVSGGKLVSEALSVWKSEHAALEEGLRDADRLRVDLRALVG